MNHPFTLVFLVFLAVTSCVQIWLARRQIRFISSHREAVPDEFTGKVTLEAHQKAADYSIAKLRLGFIEILIGVVLLLAWTLVGGMALLDGLVRSIIDDPLYTGTTFIIAALIISSILDIPLSLYKTFVIEEKFGFNKSTPALFISDQFKNLLLLLVIGIPLALAVLWLMINSGHYWWIYAWLVWTFFTLLMMWAYPVLIAPLFNKFSPLDDNVLKQRIENLLGRCGFTSSGIFVVDGSKRSGHSNAYFSGLGASKRVVFFDTIIELLSHNEIEAVLAHELGHYRHKHIQKGLLVMSLYSLAGFAILGWLAGTPWFYAALGVPVPSTHTAIFLFILIIPVFSYFTQPLLSYFMRRNEFQADEFASQHADANDLIRALVKMYSENSSTLTPDPVYSSFYYSHPPAPVRVAHLAAMTGK
jgi:STE24 endopeptidase